MKQSATVTYLVWIDLEMTGLDSEHDHILEIAILITDSQLTLVHPGLHFVIHQPESVLMQMDKWCTAQHTASGLIAAVRASSVTLEQALAETLALIATYCPPQTGVLCGNSVYQDKAFLRRWAPELNAYLHYRIIDVSSVKELIARWYPEHPKTPFVKSDTHRALTDIQESIAELHYYRTNFFVL